MITFMLLVIKRQCCADFFFEAYWEKEKVSTWRSELWFKNSNQESGGDTLLCLRVSQEWANITRLVRKIQLFFC